MRVALVHDFLLQYGGAEKVLEALHDMYPTAPVYTSAYDPGAMPGWYGTWDIRTTFLQRLPAKRRLHRLALPLYPLAFESLDLSAYDLVISSSSAFAKGVITPPHCTHISYTHTPMRFGWAAEGYMRRERASRLARIALAPVLHYLRNWDAVAAARVDRYIANSSTVAARIRKYYRADCDIVHPPVETNKFRIAPEVDDYCFIASRCIPYKRLDLAVDAFTRMGRRLKIAGGGRQMQALKASAGPTIEFLGHVSDDQLRELMSRAKAYVMPGEEDFGIAAVEANACGRPVIAYGAGGALDSQVNGVTAVLFEQQTVESLCGAVERADRVRFRPGEIRAHALGFDAEAFAASMRQAVRLACAAPARPELAFAVVRHQAEVAV